MIFFFSLGYRLFARRKDWIGTWVSPLAGLIVGLTGVLATNALIAFVVPVEYRALVITTTLCLALIFVIAQRPKFYLTPVPSLVFWVPFITHIYVLIAGLISGVILDPPFLLLVGLLMIAVAFYLHRPTIWQILD